MFQYIAQEEKKPWILGPYEGVQLKILHKDEESGGVVVLRKFEAGIEVRVSTCRFQVGTDVAQGVAIIRRTRWKA